MFDDLLEANRAYASGFDLAGIQARADKGFALVTCMDSRIEPLTMLGLVPGDAKIIRNAGGRATLDVLRSLVLATSFLGVRRIAVMHHTELRPGRPDRRRHPGRASAEGVGDADGWEFLAMPDPDARPAPRRRRPACLRLAARRRPRRGLAVRRGDRPGREGGPLGLTVGGPAGGRGPVGSNWEGRAPDR